MHSAETVSLVFDLVGRGLNDCEIARMTGVPRSTVRDWRVGKVPMRAAGHCEICAGKNLVRPNQRVRIGRHSRDRRCIEVSMYYGHWPCLFPQHGPGRKHLRRIELAGWQSEIVERHRKAMIRGLLHSDGCRVVANDRGVKSVRYHFSNLSKGIQKIYRESLDDLEIPWTQPSHRDIAVYRKAATALLDEFVGPKR
jgi:hypothetical protein